MRIAKSLGRNDVRIDSLRDQKGHNLTGTSRRQGQIVVDPLPLKLRTDRLIIGVAVYDNLGVLKTCKLGDYVVREFRLAGRAELITPRRKQQVGGLDKAGLALQPGNLRLKLLVLRLELLVLRTTASYSLLDTQPDTSRAASGTAVAAETHFVVITSFLLVISPLLGRSLRHTGKPCSAPTRGRDDGSADEQAI